MYSQRRHELDTKTIEYDLANEKDVEDKRNQQTILESEGWVETARHVEDGDGTVQVTMSRKKQSFKPFVMSLKTGSTNR
jgi:hypothetical protein